MSGKAALERMGFLAVVAGLVLVDLLWSDASIQIDRTSDSRRRP